MIIVLLPMLLAVHKPQHWGVCVTFHSNTLLTVYTWPFVGVPVILTSKNYTLVSISVCECIVIVCSREGELL